MKTLLKFLQRRFYTFLNSWWGFTLFLLLNYYLVSTIITLLVSRSNSLRGITENFNNIGHVDGRAYLAYAPIDVVYTWVNGSDPVWLEKKAYWKAHYERLEQPLQPTIDTALFSNTSFAVNQTVASATIATNTSDATLINDERMSDNRYRDSDELRYSLRSLVKHAPWIRHIYLVTDNQIPWWLNLETEHLTVLSHHDIFINKSNLPVFSSPAIESQLHHIPGLSKKFIYFNDDVFLGAPVRPDDFYALNGAQKFVMSWDVPKCSPGCSDNWIGDGFCDKACNVSACNFDYPDCVNATSNSNSHGYSSSSSSRSVHCAQGCPDNWLADKICDQRCKNAECGYDVGDCGIDLVTDNFYSVVLTPDNAIIVANAGADVADVTSDSYPYAMDDEYAAYHMFNDERAEMMSHDHDIYHDAELGGTDSNTSFVSIANNSTSTNSTLSSDNDLQTIASSALPSLSYMTSRHRASLPVALTVPYLTNAVYFDLSWLPCSSQSSNTSAGTVPTATNAATNISSSADNTTGTTIDAIEATAQCIRNQQPVDGFTFISAHHNDDNTEIIHTSTLVSRYRMLVVLLYHDQENAPTPSNLPLTVKFTVTGSYRDPSQLSESLSTMNAEADQMVTVEFLLRVTPAGESTSESTSSSSGDLNAFDSLLLHSMTQHQPVLSQISAVPREVLTAAMKTSSSADANNIHLNYYLPIRAVTTLSTPFVALTTRSTDNTFDRLYLENIARTDADRAAASASVAPNAGTLETTSAGDANESLFNQLFSSNDNLVVINSHTYFVVKTLNGSDGTILEIGLDASIMPADALQLSLNRVVVQYNLTLPDGSRFETVLPLTKLLLTLANTRSTAVTSSIRANEATKNRSEISNTNFYFQFSSGETQPPSNLSEWLTLRNAANGFRPIYQHTTTSSGSASTDTGNSPSTSSSKANKASATSLDNNILYYLLLLPKPVQLLNYKREWLHESLRFSYATSVCGSASDSAYTDTADASAETKVNGITWTDDVVWKFHIASCGNSTGNTSFSSAQRASLLLKWNSRQCLLQSTIPTSSSTSTNVGSSSNTMSEIVGATTWGYIDTTVNDVLDAVIKAQHPPAIVNSTQAVNAVRTNVASAGVNGSGATTGALHMSATATNTTASSTPSDGINDHQRKLTTATTTYATWFSLDKLLLQFIRIRQQLLHNDMVLWVSSSAFIRTLQQCYNQLSLTNLHDSLFQLFLPAWQPNPATLTKSTSTHDTLNRRRLTDTYAQSLIRVNRLYNQKFGTEPRKVPAHYPHMIDRTMVHEMQQTWPDLWTLTASNRFRSASDMQYSFSYYHYVINRNKVKKPDFLAFLTAKVDTNNNGILDLNEFRTLVAVVKGKEPEASDYTKLWNCITNSSTIVQTYSSNYQEKIKYITRIGTIEKSFSIKLFPIVQELLNCSMIREGLEQNVKWDVVNPTSTIESDANLVAFEMINDNYNDTLKQLDSVRARQSKFICINDNMMHPSPQLVLALKEFYQALYPIPSIFELPDSKSNPTLYLTEYQELVRLRNNVFMLGMNAVVTLYRSALSYSLSVLRMGVSKLAYLLLQFVGDELVLPPDLETEVFINGMRKQLKQQPVNAPHLSTQNDGSSSTNSYNFRKKLGKAVRAEHIDSHTNQTSSRSNANTNDRSDLDSLSEFEVTVAILGIIALVALRIVIKNRKNVITQDHYNMNDTNNNMNNNNYGNQYPSDDVYSASIRDAVYNSTFANSIDSGVYSVDRRSAVGLDLDKAITPTPFLNYRYFDERFGAAMRLNDDPATHNNTLVNASSNSAVTTPRSGRSLRPDSRRTSITLSELLSGNPVELPPATLASSFEEALHRGKLQLNEDNVHNSDSDHDGNEDTYDPSYSSCNNDNNHHHQHQGHYRQDQSLARRVNYVTLIDTASLGTRTLRSNSSSFQFESMQNTPMRPESTPNSTYSDTSTNRTNDSYDSPVKGPGQESVSNDGIVIRPRARLGSTDSVFSSSGVYRDTNSEPLKMSRTLSRSALSAGSPHADLLRSSSLGIASAYGSAGDLSSLASASNLQHDSGSSELEMIEAVKEREGSPFAMLEDSK